MGGITLSLPLDVSSSKRSVGALAAVGLGNVVAEDNLMGVSGVGSMAKPFALGSVSLADSSY